MKRVSLFLVSLVSIFALSGCLATAGNVTI